MILEAAIDDFQIAKQSVKNGANRLEVCSDLMQDGFTPSVDLFNQCKSLKVPCFVMIRPNKSSFVVNREDLFLMQEQILTFKKLRADGFVLGALTPNYEIDKEKLLILVETCHPLPVTFHKAIDKTTNILLATKTLLNTGIKRILTSGGKPTVEEGIDIIKQMYKIVGNKIILVAGGKVNYNNIKNISTNLSFCEFHGRNIVKLSNE